MHEGNRTITCARAVTSRWLWEFFGDCCVFDLRGKMSVQVEHQLDPSPKPHPMLIAIQANQLALTDPKRPELGWKLVRDEHAHTVHEGGAEEEAASP